MCVIEVDVCVLFAVKCERVTKLTERIEQTLSSCWPFCRASQRGGLRETIKLFASISHKGVRSPRVDVGGSACGRLAGPPDDDDMMMCGRSVIVNTGRPFQPSALVVAVIRKCVKPTLGVLHGGDIASEMQHLVSPFECTCGVYTRA